MKSLVTLFAIVLIPAFSTTPTVGTILAEGREVIDGDIGALIGYEGATLTGVDRSLTFYWTPDGKLEVSIRHTEE